MPNLNAPRPRTPEESVALDALASAKQRGREDCEEAIGTQGWAAALDRVNHNNLSGNPKDNSPIDVAYWGAWFDTLHPQALPSRPSPRPANEATLYNPSAAVVTTAEDQEAQATVGYMGLPYRVPPEEGDRVEIGAAFWENSEPQEGFIKGSRAEYPGIPPNCFLVETMSGAEVVVPETLLSYLKLATITENTYLAIAQATHIEQLSPTAQSVVSGIAKAYYTIAWDTAMQEAGHRFSQQTKIDDEVPEPSEAASALALLDAQALCRVNGVATLEELLQKAIEADGKGAPAAIAESFGFNMGAQMLGNGASWRDNHADFDYKTPHSEFHLSSEEAILAWAQPHHTVEETFCGYITDDLEDARMHHEENGGFLLRISKDRFVVCEEDVAMKAWGRSDEQLDVLNESVDFSEVPAATTDADRQGAVMRPTVSIHHPYHKDVTTESALSLARTLMYGPIPKESDPTPSVNEAIELIHQRLATCGFTWITGTVSEEVLRLTRGESIELS